MSRRRKTLIVSFIVFVVLFTAATVRLFMLPARNSPRHVDAIVVLGGAGSRVQTGVRLAREGYAPNLVVSTPGGGCPDPIPNVRLTCFRPDPSTTQGEARYASEAARKNGWKSLLVVTTTPQTTRARIRFKRCTDVAIAYVTAKQPATQWPYSIAYEWAALAKALVLQRTC
jgi:uncharacterized SAM-binding protein YcdF (DUF218 family)